LEQTTLLKSEVAKSITDKLGIPAVHFSSGSTEPKELFLGIADSLGMDIESAKTKPGLARSIVESSGGAWLPQYESSGSTVTLEGLLAVQSAVEFFLSNRP
jgi:hypothetical protein